VRQRRDAFDVGDRQRGHSVDYVTIAPS
jgi:hypothetical protein